MKKLLLKQGIKIREEDFGLLVFNPSTFLILQINRIGAQILELCDGKRSASNILALLNADNKEIEESIRSFVKIAATMDIIKEVDDE
mgnify:CR=1 FL=1